MFCLYLLFPVGKRPLRRRLWRLIMQRQRSRGRILRLETVETVVRIPWPSHLHARICKHNICVHNICQQYAQHTRTVRHSTACSSIIVTQPDARARRHRQTKRKPSGVQRRATSGVQPEAAVSSRFSNLPQDCCPRQGACQVTEAIDHVSDPCQ
jgi:hypothetical protein